jgi:hypothetical protein
MYAGTSISAGMKGASKAMAAMNKVRWKTAMLAVIRYQHIQELFACEHFLFYLLSELLYFTAHFSKWNR